MTNSNDDNGINDQGDVSTHNKMLSPKLIVFGNPLLDITAKATDDALLSKYNLERNGQKEVSLEKLHKLVKDAKERYKAFKFSLGGSSLNTCRILSSLGERNLTFIGGIGKDSNGKIVKEILKRSSVNSHFQEHDDYKTGTCLCLCRGDSRSLTANIGAALKVDKKHVTKYIEGLNSAPQLYYIEGFFIPDKMDICTYLFEYFSKHSETLLVTNLNAPYIVKNFTTDITWLTKNADIVFGNRDEFEELAIKNGYHKMEDHLTDLLNNYTHKSRKKVIIITDGSNPVQIYEGNSNSIDMDSYDVPEVHPANIVDTTGAGDSFVGGFLHSYLRKNSIKDCVKLGCKISAEVITVIGCNLKAR